MPPRSSLVAAAIATAIVGASVALAAASPPATPGPDAAQLAPVAAPDDAVAQGRPAGAGAATTEPIVLPTEGDWLKRTPSSAPTASAATPDPTSSPAPAAPTPTSSRWDAIGAQALQRVALDWAELGWAVDFQPGRGGRLGLAVRERQVVEVYVRDGHTEAEVAATLAHELAHVVDFEQLTDADRQRWLATRGLTGVVWWPPCSCDDRAYGAGDLAEAAAVLASGTEHWTGHHSVPTADQLAVAAELLGWGG